MQVHEFAPLNNSFLSFCESEITDSFFGTTPSSRGTFYQGCLTWLRALQGLRHGGSRIGKDRGGRTGGTRRAGTGSDQRESLGDRGGPERGSRRTAGTAGPAPWDGENIYKHVHW